MVLTVRGAYLFLDAVLVHPDPQSALAFVVMAHYPWCAIAACESMLRRVPWMWRRA
jgi:hypothetical protein